MFVRIHNGGSFALLYRNENNLLCQLVTGYAGTCFLLTTKRKLILIFAGNLEISRYILTRFGHRIGAI